MITVSNVTCPSCGAKELHPDGDKLLIRAYKHRDELGHWWSQCLVCSGYYDPELNETQENYSQVEGWF